MKLPYFQSVFTCSKLTIEILENGVKYVQNSKLTKKDTRTTSIEGILLIHNENHAIIKYFTNNYFVCKIWHPEVFGKISILQISKGNLNMLTMSLY